MKRHSRSFRPCLGQLRPYVAGKGYAEISRRYGFPPEQIVKLGSNENPYGPSPRAIEALRSLSPERYPEPEGFIDGLSKYTGFPPENVIIGAGMDGVIDTLARLFLEDGKRTLIHTPTFSYYEIVSILCGSAPLFVERGKDFDVPLEIPEGVDMVFLCSPNNPTGNATPEAEVREIVEGTGGVVFLDEAYVDFAKKSLIKLAGDYENLVVGRTMSKAFGLAGLRLGYALAPEWIASQYRRAAPPFFGVTSASLAAGEAALEDLEHMRRSVSKIKAERQRLEARIRSHPSEANFLYIETSEPSGVVAERFLSSGIIVRDCQSFRGAGTSHIRVTVGTPEQNERFLEAYWKICA